MGTEEELTTKSLLFQWILFNVIIISTVAPVVVLMQLIYGTYGFDTSHQMTANIILAAVLSFLFGFCQCQILQPYFMNAKQWMWASFSGLSIGLSLILLENYFATNWKTSEVSIWLLSGVIIGTTLGVAQWLFLRQHVKFSGAWILANILGWSMGLEWGWSIWSANQTDNASFIVIFFSSVFCFAITYSGITGVLLALFLHFLTKNSQTPAA